MKWNAIFFISLLLTSLVLAPALAHLLSLPNKITLSKEAYLVAQRAYDGWAALGIVIILAIISLASQSFMVRKERNVFIPTIVALCCLFIAQGIFWSFTYPANQKTNNWTYLPDNWMQLRNVWEYSHAAIAIFDFFAFVLVSFSILNRKLGDKEFDPRHTHKEIRTKMSL